MLLEKIISFRLEKGIILVPGSVNGVKGHFAFDTGATQTVINHCHVSDDSKAETDAITFDQGTQSSAVSFLHHAEIVLDTVRIEREDIALMDMTYVETPMKRECSDLVFLGAIGHDLIDEWKVLIDYPERRIIINPESVPDDLLKIPFTTNRLPMIELEIAEKSYCFILDTGANAFLFDKEVAPMSEIEAIEAKEGDPPQQIRQLTFAGLTYNNVPGMVSDMTAIKAALPEADGIIGYGLLKDRICVFDFRSNELLLSK